MRGGVRLDGGPLEHGQLILGRRRRDVERLVGLAPVPAVTLDDPEAALELGDAQHDLAGRAGAVGDPAREPAPLRQLGDDDDAVQNLALELDRVDVGLLGPPPLADDRGGLVGLGERQRIVQDPEQAVTLVDHLEPGQRGCDFVLLFGTAGARVHNVLPSELGQMNCMRDII